MRLSLKLLGINFRELSTLDYIGVGLLGIYVINPMMSHAAFTHFKASEWRPVLSR